MIQVNLDVDGMMCGQCEAHVKDAIRKKIPEAQGMRADHTAGTASFKLENAMPVSMIKHEIEEAFQPIGYKLVGVTTEEVSEKKKKGLFGFLKK